MKEMQDLEEPVGEESSKIEDRVSPLKDSTKSKPKSSDSKKLEEDIVEIIDSEFEKETSLIGGEGKKPEDDKDKSAADSEIEQHVKDSENEGT